MKTENKLSPEMELLSEVFRESRTDVTGWFQGSGIGVEADLKNAINSVLTMLPTRYATAIRCRFGIDSGSSPLTYKAVGVELSVSGGRARQIVAKSLRLLRHPRRIWVLARFTPHHDPTEEARRLGTEQAAEKTFEEALALYGDWSVENLELSVRAINVLYNANILTFSELCQKTGAELLKRRDFGKKCLREIEEKLGKWGLRLVVDPHVQLEVQKRP